VGSNLQRYITHHSQLGSRFPQFTRWLCGTSTVHICHGKRWRRCNCNASLKDFWGPHSHRVNCFIELYAPKMTGIRRAGVGSNLQRYITHHSQLGSRVHICHGKRWRRCNCNASLKDFWGPHSHRVNWGKRP
jgi:hypothetical protein